MSDEIIINGKDEEKLLEFVGVDNAGGVIYHYQGKPFTGCIEWYDDNGNLESEERFIDGHAGGWQREYFPNGQLKSEYYKNFGRIDKHFKTWDENGTLLSHTIWEDGKRVKAILQTEEMKENWAKEAAARKRLGL